MGTKIKERDSHGNALARSVLYTELEFHHLILFFVFFFLLFLFSLSLFLPLLFPYLTPPAESVRQQILRGRGHEPLQANEDHALQNSSWSLPRTRHEHKTLSMKRVLQLSCARTGHNQFSGSKIDLILSRWRAQARQPASPHSNGRSQHNACFMMSNTWPTHQDRQPTGACLSLPQLDSRAFCEVKNMWHHRHTGFWHFC